MRSNSALGALFGLLFLGFLSLGLYHLVGFGAVLFAGINPEVATILVTAAVTLLLGASIIAGGLHGIGRRKDVRQQRAARAAVYEQFLRLRSGAQRNSAPALGERRFLVDDVHAPDQQMLLLASAEVLKAYLRLQRVAQSGEGEVQHETVRLVRAMRRDLGHRAPDVGAPELSEIMRLPAREDA